MKQLIPLAALALLTACATAPQVSAPATAPAAADRAASRTLPLLRRAGGAESPTLSEIERAFGAPDLSRQDGAGTALTYRYERCALLLLFAADGRNTMRLAEAHPGPRRTGAPAPSLEACAAEADARRS